MRIAGKIACLLFLFILTSPLYAEPSDEEPPDIDEGLFFFEELFIIEEALSFESLIIDEELLTGEEPSPNEEIILAEEPPLDEGILVSAPESSGEDSDPQPDPQDDASMTPDSPLAEILPDEEIDFDDDAFFFESPPLIFEVPTFEMRSFFTVFPNLSPRQKVTAMSNTVLRNSFTKDESPTLIPNPDLEIDLLSSVMKKSPSHLIEALMLVPYNEKEFDLLDIYNALGRIEKIKEYYAPINDRALYIFTESTRIESARKRRAIPDPLPAVTLPFSESIYLCLKEINLGNLFIRADISISMYGITYSMVNFIDVRYFLVPVVKAERYITIIYLEPVKEGILIYSITGFYLPGFLADKINLTPNINRRILIFINWITDGLREQEK